MGCNVIFTQRTKEFKMSGFQEPQGSGMDEGEKFAQTFTFSIK